MPAAEFDPSEQLDRARHFAARGWRPFPVQYRGKRPHVIVGKWGTNTASAAPEKMLVRWFGSEPVNIGIAAKGSGLLILDEDQEGAFARLAADYDQVVPETYRVRTAKGWHYYFQAPDDVALGNRPGILADYGIDVRGGGDGDGGYVVAAGSVHESDIVYTADDPEADEVLLPWWIVELLLPAPEPTGGPAGGSDESELLGDDSREFTRTQAIDYIQKYAVERVNRATEGHRNTAFNNACYLVGHFTGPDVGRLMVASVARDRLRLLGQAIGLEAVEIQKTIGSALTKGMEKPYVVVPDPEPREDSFEAEVTAAMRKMEIQHEATRRIRLKARADRPSILSGVLDDLDSIEPPTFLMKQLIPDQAVGFLAGRSGSYKSFLAVGWAFAIATGQPWLPGFEVASPLKTLYVAAEGYAGAAARIKAWEERTGSSRAGKLLLYPRPIALNDEDQAAELAEVVAELGIKFLVIDTYHRSAPGTEENDATAFGLVFDAVARLRDDMGVGVLFVDHTGKIGTDPRGSSAKGDDADYVLVANYEGTERGASITRTLTVRKLKDEESGQGWPLLLSQPTSDNGLAVGFPVVVIPDDVDAPELLTPDAGDWRDKAPAFPEAELDGLMAVSNKGRYVRPAQGIWRLLAHLDEGAGNGQGLTLAAILRMMNDGGDDQVWSEQSVRKGAGLLVNAKLAERKGDRVWLLEKD